MIAGSRSLLRSENRITLSWYNLEGLLARLSGTRNGGNLYTVSFSGLGEQQEVLGSECGESPSENQNQKTRRNIYPHPAPTR